MGKKEVFYVRDPKLDEVTKVEPGTNKWSARDKETRKRKYQLQEGQRIQGFYFEAGWYILPFWEWQLVDEKGWAIAPLDGVTIDPDGNGDIYSPEQTFEKADDPVQPLISSPDSGTHGGYEAPSHVSSHSSDYSSSTSGSDSGGGGGDSGGGAGGD